MKTYTAQIIYKIECEGIATEQYEQQWRLVLAEDDENALREARKMAREEESTFVDRHGRTVFWKLLAVKELKEIDLSNGCLLFSEIKEVEPLAAPVWMG
ncbi:DUF4288 domain-containing protein [Chitinophagaceae bacterium MMS25-I14]